MIRPEGVNMKIHFDDIFAVTAPGLEEVCAREIKSLLDAELTVEKGGVSFSGSLEDLYRVNLWSRIASRILVRVGEVKATDFPELFRKVKRLPWGRFIRTDMPVVVRSTSRRSRLNHSDRISETIVDAIDGALGRKDVVADEPSQLVVVRIDDDVCRVSVDSSGDLLHRRGYRTEVSRAPLRETLAAGILKILDWDGQVPLYDPMCGSGPFVLEGALISNNQPPGQFRAFAFQQWPRYREGLWNNLLVQSRQSASACLTPLYGSDADADVIESALRNAERASCRDLVQFETQAIEQVKAPAGKGVVICNPPYGIRLGKESELQGLYAKLGLLYAKEFKGWQGVLFCPSEKLVAETGLNFKIKVQLFNGGIKTNLFVCDL